MSCCLRFLDDTVLLFVFLFLKVVSIKSVKEKFNCCVFVLCGVVGGVRDDGVCEGRFPVYDVFRLFGVF